jgi:P27 family predicted phage terminase small subunit
MMTSRAPKAPKATGRPRKPAAPSPPPIAPVANIPDAPTWLSKPARAEWIRSAALLVERGTLTDGDLAVLEVFCSAKGRLVEASRLLARDGLTVKGANGARVKHPAVSIASEASSLIRTLGQQLGLTPASRARAASHAPKARSNGSNSWDGLLDG